MDPRIARRWVEVRREEGRRRLRLLLGAGGLLVAMLLAVGSLWTPLFKVRHVSVVVLGGPAGAAGQSVVGQSVMGQSLIGRSQVTAAAGFDHRRLMIDVDARAVEQRLDDVPGLGAAQVSVHWPGTVSIRVIGRVPVAVVSVPAPTGGVPRWGVVDATGRILSTPAVPPPGLPVIYGPGRLPAPGEWMPGSAGPDVAPVVAAPKPGGGPGGGPPVDMDAASGSPSAPAGVAEALAVVTALPPAIRAQVQSLTIGPAAGSQLRLTVVPARAPTGSVTVTLGDGTQLNAKLTTLETLLTQANLAGVSSLDLTVPDRPAALTGATNPG